MAKNGLFSKIFGKQESGCCSVSFEEVSEEETSRGSSPGEQRGDRPQQTDAGSGKRQESASERSES